MSKSLSGASLPLELRTFQPGLYEINFSFTYPEFVTESMYFDWQGRRTGPWDYAPYGEHTGDCLLPCVYLIRNGIKTTKSRVFIPRQEELDKHWFNGKIGFYVEQPEELELCLGTDSSVKWDEANISRVDDFCDDTITRDGLDVSGRLWIDDHKLATLLGNWPQSPYSQKLEKNLDCCCKLAPPPTLKQARVIVSEYLPEECKLEDNCSFYGDYLAALSLRVLISNRGGDVKQLFDWIDTLIELPVWGNSDDPNGRDHNNDLTADINMLGLATALSWHGHCFGEERLNKVKEKIAYQAEQMFKWITSARSSWPGTSTQNHAFFGFQTLLLSGVSLIDDDPRALSWIQIAAAAFRKFASHLPSDGSFHEGVGYISYGLQGLMPSLFLLEQITGKKWIPETWLENHWIAMNQLAPEDISNGFALDDGDKAIPCFMPIALRALKHTDSKKALKAVRELLLKLTNSNKGLQGKWFIGYFWALIMAPEIVDIKAELPAVCDHAPLQSYLPAAGYFIFTPQPDLKACFLTAPPHGFELFKKERHTYCYGHHHPDTGNILLNYRGKWALADTGYTFCKASSEHNVLLLDGQGQHNDTYVWMPPPPWNIDPQPAEVEEHPWGVLAAAELSCHYPSKLGLNKWRRSFYGFKDGAMVVVDEVEANEAGIFTISWGSDFVWEKEKDGFCNESGIKLLLPDNDISLVCEDIIPSKRFLKTTATWHALRLNSPKPETSRRFVSIFVPADMDIRAEELMQRCGL